MSIFLESLEARIAPATLVNAKTVAFTDVNDDLVHVQFSKAVLTADNWESFFIFQDLGNNHENLLSLDLTDTLFAGTSVKVSVVETHGDGIVDVGAILAGGNDLGAVTVGGGLVKIEAGNSITPAKGLQALTVDSLGVLSPMDFGLADRMSLVQGKLGALNVAGDVAGSLFVTGGADAGIGSIKIGGALLAGGGDQAGWISAAGNIGNITVGGLDGRLADGDHEAGIVSGGKVGNLTVNGSIIAGEFANTGTVSATLSVGKVTIHGNIGRDVNGVVDAGSESGSIMANGGTMGPVFIEGSILGGTGNFSGSIYAASHIGKITVLGGVIGGGGESSGEIFSSAGNLGAVNIGQNVESGTGLYSGFLGAGQSIARVTIGGSVIGGVNDHGGLILASKAIGPVSIAGSLLGGDGDFSGAINATTKLGVVKVLGDVSGGAGDNSGSIQAGTSIAKVFIGQSLLGGTGNNSGFVGAGDKIGSVSVGGDIQGSSAQFSGAIAGQHGLGVIHVGGSLLGGTGLDAGVIQAGSETISAGISKVFITGNVQGNDGVRSGTILAWGDNMKSAWIGGSITGGAGLYSALIYASNNFGKAIVGGDVIGGTGNFSGRIATDSGNLGVVTIGGKLEGGLGDNSGTLFAGKNISKVVIGKDMIGGAGAVSGSVGVMRPDPMGSIYTSEKIGKIFIGTTDVPGSVTGGTGDYSAAIMANSSLSAITITGDLEGGTGASSGSVETSGSLSKVRVGNILGGENIYTGRVYAGANIGKVSVLGSMIGGDYSYSGCIIGNSKIGSVEILGDLVGGNNAYGDTQRTGTILSGKIGSVKIWGNLESGTKVDPTKLLTDSGAIRSVTTIGAMTVGGSMIGNTEVPVLITAQFLVGPVNNNVTIKSINVAHDVSHTLILAGTDLGSPPNWSNPFARINSVIVGGNWEASSISAGAQPGPSGYGAGDTLAPNTLAPGFPAGTYSKIGKINIAGSVLGGANGEQYGFVSANFGSIKISGQNFSSPSAGGTLDVTPDGKVKIHRISGS